MQKSKKNLHTFLLTFTRKINSFSLEHSPQKIRLYSFDLSFKIRNRNEFVTVTLFKEKTFKFSYTRIFEMYTQILMYTFSTNAFKVDF